MSKGLEKRLDLIESKLDIIFKEIEEQKRKREGFEELKDDLNRVLRTITDTLVSELDDVSDNIRTGTFLYIMKKALRNINSFSKIFDQIESLEDFVRDFSPLTKTLSIDLMNKLEEFENKGYFGFLKNMIMITDKIVVSFSDTDFKDFESMIDDISSILKKLLTKENLKKFNYFIDELNREEEPQKISYFNIIKELNSKETKKILYKVIVAIKSFEK